MVSVKTTRSLVSEWIGLEKEISLTTLFLSTSYYQMSHDMTIPTKWLCAQWRLKISLGIHPVWSESLPFAQWVAKDPSFLHVDSEDSGQTVWMARLIWVFAGCTATLLVLSCRGSNVLGQSKTHKMTYEPLQDKTNKIPVHPARTVISLGIHLVWSESSLCTQWAAIPS